jgi:hypothetical protein
MSSINILRQKRKLLKNIRLTIIDGENIPEIMDCIKEYLDDFTEDILEAKKDDLILLADKELKSKLTEAENLVNRSMFSIKLIKTINKSKVLK